MWVEKVGTTWTMVSSYWDAGYVKLNVNDPANPRFIDDSDFTDPDPEMGVSPPEGNGHYAELDRKKRFIIGTDEDFSPFRTAFQVTSGPNAGPYPAGEFGWSNWKNWNTSPTCCPRQAASPDSDREPRSAPAARTVPEVGRSIPASRFSNVVLPLPDRPTTATNSPCAMSRLRWSTATTSPAPNG
jgi:hypothetical protein